VLPLRRGRLVRPLRKKRVRVSHKHLLVKSRFKEDGAEQ
jgi:hypothetical protein